MEAPRGSSIAVTPAQTAAPDQTTTSGMEVESEGAVRLEKVSVRKTADTEMLKGLELLVKTDNEKTAPVQMKPQIEEGAHISREGTKIHSLRGLRFKPQGPDLNRIKFPSINPTLGSKGGEQRSREDVTGM